MLHAWLIAVCILGGSTKEANLEIGSPSSYANLAVFPITLKVREADPASRYITLDEGVKQNLIEVKEMGESTPSIQRVRPARDSQERQSSYQPSGAEVNRLKIFNKSNKTLILLAGEMVVGGKQDRIVQKDTLIKPGKDGVPLSVFCVEQGRWEGGKAKFGTTAGGFGGNVADPSVRGVAQAKSEQSAVWSSVAGQNNSLGVNNSTQTYRGAIDSKKVQADVSAYLEAIKVTFPKNAVGAIVAINGKLVWIDLFPTSQTLFNLYWPKLLRSYAMDALSARAQKPVGPAATIGDAKRFLTEKSGKSTFEGSDKLFKLTRIESNDYVIYEMEDISMKPVVHLHTCKMLKR
jgi:hypothetical protein